MARDYRHALIWLLGIVLLAVVALLHGPGLYRVETNLMQLLPSVEQPPMVEQARERLTKSTERRLLFLVTAGSAKKATDAGVRLREAVLESDLLHLSDQQKIQRQMESFYRHLYPYRYQLLTEDIAAQLDNDPMQFVQNATALLYSPTAFSRAKSLERDPLYLFGSYFEQLFPSTMTLEDGVLLGESEDKHHGLVIAEVKLGAFDLGQQAQLLELIETLRAGFSDDVGFRATGLPLYAASGASRAQSEIRLVGIGSLIGIVLLLVITFGSLRPLLLAVFAVATGVLSAWTATSLLFDRLHILTLVFGASLVGVAVDYCLHYFCCHLGREEGETANSTIAERRRHVVRGLALALVTSSVAYLSMASAPFPGLRQMAVFSATGLLFAWLSVVLLFPLLLRGSRWPRRKTLLSVSANTASRWGRYVVAHKWLFALFLAVVAVGITRLASEDDVRQLQTPDRQLQAQESYIKSALPEAYDSRFFVVVAANETELLERERQLVGKLEQLREQGGVAGYKAVSQVIPNVGKQQSNYRLLGERLYDSGAVRNYLEELGFTKNHIEEEYRAFEQAQARNLSLANWMEFAPEPWHSLLLERDQENYGSIVRLQNVNDIGALGHLAKLELPTGVYFVDTVSETSSAMAKYRERASLLLALGVLAAVVLLSCWLGKAKALIAVAVPLVAIVVTLGVLGWLGETLNLFRVFALLLVLGIGADFGIFAVRQRGLASHTALAITLSAVTTLLAFGLLSISETEAVRSFGQTLLIGIAAALFTAPVAARLQER